MSQRTARAVVFGLAFVIGLGVAALVFEGKTSPWLAVVWLLCLVAFALAARDRPSRTERTFRPSSAAILLFAAALPVAVRVAHFDSNRMHPDEFLTGYFSATHDFAHSSFFGYMPEKWEWQGQFPKPYFFIQRAFFAVFGTSALTLRLSVQVHVAVVSVMLFLIVRELLDRRSALVAVVLYSFLAVSVYLETLGFFFIGATAVFTAFCYFALRQYRTGDAFDAAMSGIACGFCYLMYYSSYLAFPVLVAFSAAQWLRERKIRRSGEFRHHPGRDGLVLAPFAGVQPPRREATPCAARTISRSSREPLPTAEAIAAGRARFPYSGTTWSWTSVLFPERHAGGGGFDFGTSRSSTTFPFGCWSRAPGRRWRSCSARRRSCPSCSSSPPYVAMVAIAIPPPTCHRFALAFPFLVILMTLPLRLPAALPEGPRERPLRAGRRAPPAVCLHQRAPARGGRLPRRNVRRAPAFPYLVNRYPDRNVYVAAYDAFAYGKIFYFLDTSKNRRVETGFHDHLLRKLNPKRKYVYVLTLGDASRKRFEKEDPRGRYYRFSIGYSLFAN